MAIKYDTLYYYRGGAERGEWFPVACTPAEFEAKEKELRRAGYVTRRGDSKIGPPEGPPVEFFATREEWRAAIAGGAA